MATFQTFRDGLCEHNRKLDAGLRDRVGLTVDQYRALKVVLQWFGVGAGIYAMWLGSPPAPIMLMITVIIAGPELFEYSMTNGES